MRAVETAEPIARALDLPIRRDRRLRELDLGRWQGLTREEIAETYPDEWAEYRELYDPTFRRGGGESYAEAQERIVPVVEEIARNHAGARVAVVFHGGVLRTYLCYVLGLSLEHAWRLPLSNASISCVRPFEGLRHSRATRPGTVIVLNDVAHLEDIIGQ